MNLSRKSELSPAVNLALKALLLYVFITYRGLFLNLTNQFPFLPFIKFFDLIPPIFYTATNVILFLCIVSVFFRKGDYQLISLISGLIIIFLILSSKLLFSNSLLFVACLLILIGFYRGNDFIFRIQISLLYLGAATNKMIDPDWWNGHYFDFFFRYVFDVGLYSSLVSEGNLTVAKGIGGLTIFSECVLGVIVLIPRQTRLTIISGLIFHTGMLLITSGQLSFIFLYIMSVAYLLISGAKLPSISVNHSKKWIAKLISWLDLSESIGVEDKQVDIFTVIRDKNPYYGRKALIQLLISPQILLTLYFFAHISRSTLLPVLKFYI